MTNDDMPNEPQFFAACQCEISKRHDKEKYRGGDGHGTYFDCWEKGHTLDLRLPSDTDQKKTQTF